MELFTITVQLRTQGATFGLTYKTKQTMDAGFEALTADEGSVGIPVEVEDDFGGTVSVNTADIAYTRKSMLQDDLRRNAEHQFESAHANARLQRRVAADPLLTPPSRGGLVPVANQ